MAAEGGSALSLVEKAIGIAIAVVGAWSAYQSSVVKTQIDQQAVKLDRLRAQIAESAEEREGRKLNHEITIKIFDEVKEVYSTPNLSSEQMLNRLTSVAALLEAIPDPAVRTQLAAAVKAALDNLSVGQKGFESLLKARTERVKSQVDETVFRADDASRSAVAPSATKATATTDHPVWTNYDFDIFWCERAANPEAARQAAEATARLRQLDPAATGTWRVRKLPASVNERAGYQIDGYVMHATSDEEVRLAEALKAALVKSGIGPPDSPGAGFTIRRSSYPSPWYISVFFCPEARRT